jgi:hypothetical protein
MILFLGERREAELWGVTEEKRKYGRIVKRSGTMGEGYSTLKTL